MNITYLTTIIFLFANENQFEVYTLSRFGSLTLVTVTVTRKMFSMILSVVAFGHRLSLMQWAGVGLVFSGIGAEAEMKRREKKTKIKK